MTRPDDWIVDVDAHTFEKEVVERSKNVPVVVDFWASWCGPCEELGPRLAHRAREGAGRFVLARVDVDANAELATAFRVQGIPAVLAIVGGRLVDGFQGALPEVELDAFLDRVAPAGRSAEEEALGRARDLAEAGEASEAIALLRDHLRAKPDHAPGRILLADLLVDEKKLREAKLVFEKLTEAAQGSPEGRALRARIDFAESDVELGPLVQAAEAAPEDAGARLALGRAYVAAKEHSQGLEELLLAVRLDPGGVGAEAKQAMLEVFDLLGIEDPLANEYRFKLSMELFA